MSWNLFFFEIKPPANPEALSDVTPLLRLLRDAFGTRSLGRLLGVESTRIGAYIAGDQRMSHEMARRVIDMHDLLTRAFQVFAPDSAMRWLVSNEPFLDGSRPIDVLALRGIAPLIEALDNIATSSYA